MQEGLFGVRDPIDLYLNPPRSQNPTTPTTHPTPFAISVRTAASF